MSAVVLGQPARRAGALAKVSDTPGKTTLLNFFAINGTWSLVDLPGYGYAKVGRQQRYDFNEAVAEFIERRDNLRRVFVLIDSRLPAQAIDTDFSAGSTGTDMPFTLVSPRRTSNHRRKPAHRSIRS